MLGAVTKFLPVSSETASATFYVKALGGVETCANGGTAESQLFKLGKSDFQQLLILFQR